MPDEVIIYITEPENEVDISVTEVVEQISITVEPTGEKGDQGEPGAPGPPGPAATNFIRKHSFVPPYSYCGVAVEGSADTDEVFRIARIEVLANGTTNVMSATGAWNDRLTLIYT
jgi:hypothetical protein